MTLEALRTPHTRFSLLPGFPHVPHYADDLPGHEGPRDAETTFLCLQGEPIPRAALDRFDLACLAPSKDPS